MINFKAFLFLSALTLAVGHTSTSLAETPAIKIGNLNEWVAFPVPKDELLQRFTQNAELIITPGNKTSDESPNILVHSKQQSKGATTKEYWRKLIIDETSKKISVTHESVVNRNGEIRYLIEFQNDVGSESMLSTLIMAQVVGERLYVFTYENYHAPFQQHARAIRALLQGLELTPAS